jgi:uracil-DNA glycosylase
MKRAAHDPVPAGKKAKHDSTITAFFGPPKASAASATASATASFDKASWIAGLTAEQRGLLALEIETLHESWLGALREELVSRDFLELKRFLQREHDSGQTVFPPAADIYSW